jgi:RNA polymerase sigma factor (sigma-70 family)
MDPAMDGASLPADLRALLSEREWLRGLARALASPGAEAEDLEQETWVAALRSPPRRPGPVRGWLATILRRKASDSRRAAGRRAAREEAAARPEAFPAAAEAVARAETRRRVLEAVLSLEEPSRSTVILRWFEGLPPREIASRTGVPVETVRTRLKRALEVLRARLDEGHGGRRDAWAVALLEAAGEPEPTPSSAAVDGERRRAGPGIRFLVPAAAGLALVAAGAAVLFGPWRSGPGLPAVVPPALEVVAASGLAAPPAGDPAPGGGSAPANPIPAPVPGPARSEDPQPDATAGTGLVLRARVEPASPRFKEAMKLVATFENAGKEALTFFLPEDAGWDEPFPEWRIRGPGGKGFPLAPGMGAQKMWQAGPLGELVRLEPGASRTVETTVHGVSPERGAETRSPEPLGPGTYVVECSYVRDTRRVPWTDKFGDSSVTREVEGLWIGSVVAEPFEFRVLPGDEPAFGLAAPPGPFEAGKPCRIEITVQNGSGRPLALKGRLLLRNLVKGGGGLETALLPGDPCTAAGAGEAAVLRVDPDSTLRLPVDLALLPGDWLERNSLWLHASFEPEGGAKEAYSGLLAPRRVTPPPDAVGRGLRLLVAPAPGPSLSVLLRNDGEKPLRVPRDFAWPSRLHVAVKRPAGTEGEGWITVDEPDGRSRLTAKVIGWDVAGAPRSLTPADFVDLAPGDSMALDLPLVSDALPRFPAGEYEVQVTWRNVEGGVRAGLEQGSVLAGTVAAAPVRVEMPAR